MALNVNKRADLREIKDGFVGFWHGIGSLYRHTFDGVKPTADRVIDSVAYGAGMNAALSLGLWTANFGLEHAEAYRDWQHLLEKHNYVEFTMKALAYGAIYGAANIKHIVPTAWRIAQRQTTPDWPNHAKTWGIGAVALAAYMHGIADPAETRMTTLDNLLSGRKEAEVVRNIGSTAKTVATTGQLIAKNPGKTLDRILDAIAVEIPDAEARSIEESLHEAAIPEPGFNYGDNVSGVAASLKKRYGMTPEQFVYLTRAVYFEGGFDPLAKTAEQQREGMKAIAAVMKNRWEYDNSTDERYGRRHFGGGGDTPFDVAFRHSRKNSNGGHYTVWQFTCVRDHPEYFHEHKEEKGWDMYEGGKLHIAVGQMDKRRAQLAYEAVLDVLGKNEDPTSGALFYQNPRKVDRNNTPAKWRARGLKEITTINSHTFWSYKNGSNWEKNMNVGELEQEKKNVRYAAYAPKNGAYRGIKLQVNL